MSPTGPHLTSFDIQNCGFGNAKFNRKFPTRFVAATDLSCCTRRELRMRMVHSVFSRHRRCSSLGSHIAQVVCSRAFKQMRDVAASGIVTAMQQAVPRPASFGNEPRQMMSKSSTLAIPADPVALLVLGTEPDVATAEFRSYDGSIVIDSFTNPCDVLAAQNGFVSQASYGAA